MNINARSIRRLAMVSSLLVIGVTAGTVVSAAEPAGSTLRVQLADLDLSTPGGRDSAYERLHRAARAVCHRASEAEDLGRQIHVAACIDRLMAQASATVQQLASRGQMIQVARLSDGK